MTGKGRLPGRRSVSDLLPGLTPALRLREMTIVFRFRDCRLPAGNWRLPTPADCPTLSSSSVDNSDPGCRDIARLHCSYVQGQGTVTAMVEALISRLAERGSDPIWIHRDSDALLRARAAQLDCVPRARVAAGELPLFGVPFAVKDNIDVAGRPTSAGCPAYTYIAAQTAAAVERLLDAGAVYVGKTNLDQFATGLVGVRSPYGVPVNAIDSRYVPGGSSSGSAVAVAAGLVSFALGTDTAGSGRVPAAFNNIVGLKPTRGLVSNHGMVPACRSLDCVAVFATSCGDAQTVLDVIAGTDPLDPWSRPTPGGAGAGRSGFASALRFGVLAGIDRELFGDARAAAGYERAIGHLISLGGCAVEIDYASFAETAGLLYDGPWVAERYAAIRSFIEARPQALHPVTRAITERAREFSAVDVFEAQYRLQALRVQSERVWQGELAIEVLLLPTAPTLYRLSEVEAEPLELNTRLGRYTNFVNLLDLAAVAVPAGMRDDGLPFGVTLIAPAFRDDALLELGARLHSGLNTVTGACGLPVPPPFQLRAMRVAGNQVGDPPVTAAGVAADAADAAVAAVVTGAFVAGAFVAGDDADGGRVRIAVVGAHLSGMPLNHQLTDRGGRLVAATATAACYRLHALVDAEPPKPGLVRVGSHVSGASIAVEVWELTTEEFGRFVSGLPSPMAIGTVMLADGSEVKGFLCESAALEAAPDISGFGGWRAYREHLSRGPRE